MARAAGLALYRGRETVMRARLGIAAVLLTAWASSGLADDGSDTALSLEYRRVRPGGEAVELRLDASGQVTGKVRSVRGPDSVALESWLPPDPWLVRALESGGFWKAEAGTVAEPGARLSVQRGAEAREIFLREEDLAKGGPLAESFGVCEVLCGAGPLLAEAWLDRARVLEAEGKWEEAVAACRSGLERLPRSFPVRGPDSIIALELSLPNQRFQEGAPLARALLEGEIGLVRSVLQRGELARFFPDRFLWPDEARTSWPWDWNAPAAGAEPERLAPRDEPNRGLRYARAAAWRKPDDAGAAVDWTVALGLGTPLGVQSISGTGDGRIEFACAEVAEDVSLQERIEKHLRARGVTILRAVQVRRGCVHHTDVLARKGTRLERWVAAQSGKEIALARLDLDRAAYAGCADDVARALGSLEPCPSGSSACAERLREVACAADRSLRVLIPEGWTDQPVPGAPLRATWLDLAPPGDAPEFRLVLRAHGNLAGFDWLGLWQGLRHPGRAEVRGSGVPQHTDIVLARVLSAGCGWAEVKRSELAFGDETLPVLWFTIFSTERIVAGALVCRSADAALVSCGRMLLERLAAGLE